MSPVREVHMIRLPVNPFPGNLFPFRSKLSDLFLFWTLGNRFFVAFHTGSYRWHSSKGLGFEIGMAGVTLQALLHVFLMVEGDRLFSPGANTQTDQKKEYQDSGRQSNKEEFHTYDPFGQYSAPRGALTPRYWSINKMCCWNESYGEWLYRSIQ